MNNELFDAAVIAHGNLGTFHAVRVLLEGGTVVGDSPAARRIIKICEQEITRQLRKFDAARAKLGKEPK